MGHFEPAGEAARLLGMNAALGRDASYLSMTPVRCRGTERRRTCGISFAAPVLRYRTRSLVPRDDTGRDDTGGRCRSRRARDERGRGCGDGGEVSGVTRRGWSRALGAGVRRRCLRGEGSFDRLHCVVSVPFSANRKGAIGRRTIRGGGRDVARLMMVGGERLLPPGSVDGRSASP